MLHSCLSLKDKATTSVTYSCELFAVFFEKNYKEELCGVETNKRWTRKVSQGIDIGSFVILSEQVFNQLKNLNNIPRYPI